jgi:hypothetical protein
VRKCANDERQYVEGYRRKSENPPLGLAGAKIAAPVWAKEEWNERKNEARRVKRISRIK